MDERSILIITSKGDKTASIEEYSIYNDQVHIRYKNQVQSYKYLMRNIKIKKNPIIISGNNNRVYHKNENLKNVHEILKFDEITKVIFRNSKPQIYLTEFIRVEEIIITNNEKKFMEYLNDIARYTNTEDETEAFLKREIGKIDKVNADSVLGTYVNQAPIIQFEPNTEPIIFPFRFNLSQKIALEQVLCNQISIIEGPPGTGKTQTILNILANLAIMRGNTVAVVSGNNAAVQNVKDKLEKAGYGFIVADLGNNKKKDDFFQNPPHYRKLQDTKLIHEEQLVKQLSELSDKLNHLLETSNQKAKIEHKLSAYRLEQKHFKIHNVQNDISNIQRLFLKRQTPNTIISFLADEYFVGNRSVRFLRKAKLLFKYGFIDFKKLKENRTELISTLQMRYYESKIKEFEDEKNELQCHLDQESFVNLLKQHESISSTLFNHKLDTKYSLESAYFGDVTNYKNRFKHFIARFPIMLSTTHSIRTCIPQDFLFDYIIVDEASQVDLLTGTLALSCCKRVIIVGDTKQLPQIVDTTIKDKLEKMDIPDAYDYFNHNLLSTMLAVYDEQLPKVMLREHYRCHPKIIGFCNNQYYDNDLIPFTNEGLSDVPIRLHYTSPGNHMRKVTVKGKEGSFNHREIDSVKEEILRELQLAHISDDDIGFTTPYRLQVEEANMMLEKNIEIDTVHKYQGREKPIMILSTVLDQSKLGKIGRKFVENPRLINVAVSRAQNQFILVTDHELFRNSRKDVGNLIRYIEYNSLHEHITKSDLISVFDLLYTEYSIKLNHLQSRLISKFKYKSENIMWRVLKDLLDEEPYKGVIFGTQIYLKDLLNDTERLDEDEIKYVRNRASVDFVLYDSLNKQPLLVIEVDGFASHRNNKDQFARDVKKNNILEKYNLCLLRLPTTGSNEAQKIRSKLDEILGH